jgi:signal transduction histidine kinase
LIEGYSALYKSFPAIDKKKNFPQNYIHVAVTKSRGLLSVDEFVMFYPFELNGNTHIGTYNATTQFDLETLDSQLQARLQSAIYMAAIIVAVILIGMLFYLYQVNKTVHNLANWADTLSAGKDFKPPPELGKTGLNFLAITVNNSMKTFGEIFEKEHSFTRYTNHELRTQMAVLSANMELLDSIMENLSADERKILKRMEMAISDMKYQVEALLYISKENVKDLILETCNLSELVKKGVENNSYLLQHRKILLQVNNDETIVKSHPVLLEIVINNLLRNAFQNTFEGQIIISTTNGLRVVNRNIPTYQESIGSQGFGIGLVIVEKITQKLNIKVEQVHFEHGRDITLLFNDIKA